MKLCVYCSSSTVVGEPYRRVAAEFGAALARRGHALVYGAGNIGLMGAVAQAMRAGGGHIVGVIPHALAGLELAYDGCDELVLTATMRERKAEMERRADGFVALPGGIGTMEELLEVLTLKQLRFHDKPIVMLNTDGYWNPLLAQLDRAVAEGFARAALDALYYVASSPEAALDYLEAYRPSGLALDALVPALTEVELEAAEDMPAAAGEAEG